MTTQQPATRHSTAAPTRSDSAPANGTTPDATLPSRRKRARASLTERLSRPTLTVWLSGQEAAEHVGVSWPTLRQFLIEHGIPHVRLGNRWKIDAAVLDDHLRHLAEGQAGRR